MTPLDYYRNLSAAGTISEDPAQLAVLHDLEKVYQALLLEEKHRQSVFAFLRAPKLVKGLYLWGGVGVGKTLLMDCFFQSLPFPNKLRMHFHAFMERIHHALTHYQGQKEPLHLVASDIAREASVLCFDELFVSDIADAMVLGRLFKALFEKGVCLVTTSNIAPDDLYKHGLQRLNFLPAIALLKENTTVVHMPSAIDYRLRHLKEAGVFYTPLNEAAKQNMEKTFNVLTAGQKVSTEPVEILGRSIPIVKQAGDIIWFEFDVICQVPRSQKDYLAIAEQFKTVFISNIPIIHEDEKDKICLFISLIDVFYDANTRVVISAAEPVPQIYNRGYMILEFTRTNSRLLEMQSSDYFAGEDP